MLEVQALKPPHPHPYHSFRIQRTVIPLMPLEFYFPTGRWEMLKAVRGIGVDIFWHRPLKTMENVYMYTESASYAKKNMVLC